MTLHCIQQPHQHLNAKLQNGILTLAITRPESKNALYRTLYLWIAQALNEANQCSQVRVVVLRGAANDFTAGNDMHDFLDFIQNPSSEPAHNQPPFVLLKAAAKLTKPLIIAVKGVVVGIGVTLLLHADLVYADRTAVFQIPFVSLGLSPEGAASQLLVQQIGYHHAAELLLTARKFSAEHAERIGLVNQLCDDVYTHAEQTALQLAQLPLASIQQSKALMKHNLSEVLACIDLEAEIFMQRVQSDELNEAVHAFLEKRKPNFLQFT